MSAHAVDSPLNVLKSESMLTLQQLQQAVESYVENPADTTTLKSAINSANQMHGVFVMLGETDASTLAQEVKLLAQDLLQAKVDGSDSLYEIFLRAVLQIPRYFEWLQMEGSRPAFNLNPLINQLRQVRHHTNEIISDSKSTSRTSKNGSSDPSVLAKLAQRLRPSLQRALLGVLRGQPDSLKLLASIFSKFKENAIDDDDYSLWSLAENLLQAVLNETITLDNPTKLLLRDLDHHVKQLTEKGRIDSESIQSMVKRLSAKLPAEDSKDLESNRYASADILLINKVQLDSDITDPSLVDKETLSTIAELLKEAMLVSQDALDRVARDNGAEYRNSLASEFTRLHDVANVLTLLNMEVPASLIRSHVSVLQQGLHDGKILSSDKILQIASELILVQNALTGLGEFVYNNKMAASVAADLDDGGRVALLMDFELKRARKVISQEAIRIADRIRTFATEYLTNESEPDWQQLNPVFYYLGGTFTMLECQRAADLLEHIKSLVDLLSGGAKLFDRSQFVGRLADIMVTIEQYLKLLEDSAKPSESILDAVELHIKDARQLIINPSDTPNNATGSVSETKGGKQEGETVETAPSTAASDNDEQVILEKPHVEPSLTAQPFHERQKAKEKLSTSASKVSEIQPLTSLTNEQKSDREEEVPQLESLELSAIFDEEMDLKIHPEENYKTEDDDSIDFPELVSINENIEEFHKDVPELIVSSFTKDSEESLEHGSNINKTGFEFISSDEILEDEDSADDFSSDLGFESDSESENSLLLEDAIFDLDEKPDQESETYTLDSSNFEFTTAQSLEISSESESDLTDLSHSTTDEIQEDSGSADNGFASVNQDSEISTDSEKALDDSSLADLFEINEFDNRPNIKESDHDFEEEEDALELAVDLFESDFDTSDSFELTDNDSVELLSLDDFDEKTAEVAISEASEPTSDSYSDSLIADGGQDKTFVPPTVSSEADESFSEQDPELLEIFLEEAQGEVVSIGNQLAVWRKDMSDSDTLNSIRRSFHTLKGSGRMVGETTIGEFAWAFEQLLNRIIEGRLGPSHAIADAIEKARSLLDNMVLSGTSRGHENAVSVLVKEAEWLSSGYIPPATDESVDTPSDFIESEENLTADLFRGITDDSDMPLGHDNPIAHDKNVVEADSATTQINPYSMLTPEADPELVEVFIYEAADILDSSEFTLQQWGGDPLNQELMNNLRRDMHTLKGSSRMAGLLPIGDLAHAAESVLDAIAKGDIPSTARVTDSLQQALDGLSRMLNSVRDGTPLLTANDLINHLSALLGTTSSETLRVLQHQQILQHQQTPLETSDKTDDQEFLEVFLYEATEILEACDTTLRRWSSDPKNQQLINDLRREMHTLKGSSRMAGVAGIGDAAQSLEELFDACLNGEIEPSATVMNSVQQSLDMLDRMLGQIKNDAQPDNVETLIGEIRGLILTEPSDSTSKSALPEPIDAPEDKHTKPARRQTAMISSDTIRVDAMLLNNLINQMGESSIYRARVDQGVGALRFNLNELDQTLSRLRQQMRRLEIETEAQILFRYEEAPRDYKADFDPLELDRFAELQQLSRSLMEVVDDLTNIQNSLEDQTQNMGFLLDQQNKVNKDIQQGLMRTSMVRFSTVVPRLRRVVRQAAQELGKRAQLVIEGSEAEIDRTVLDNMVAPLEHMLRNAISHGIETPGKRASIGKPETGTITLSLSREGAELVLDLNDDGAGLDYNLIRSRGEAGGFLKPGQTVGEQDLVGLLLRPGFSTASEVTQIAGRGVGLDVLNDAIRTMRGALQIQSKAGKGTTFIIRLPFSLAVTQALLVKAGIDTYAIPMLSLEAVDRLKEGEMSDYLEGETVQHEYGKHSYPLHSLGIMFGDEVVINEGTRSSALLFRSAEASAALQVDEIVGHQEIIVKPVGPQLHNVPGISGATVLGDGRVVVVLELAALVRKLTSQAQQQMEAQALRSARQEPEQASITAMVIDDSITMRKVTARFLGRHNIDVRVAKDGIEAVAMFEEQVPDFAILDIEMPRMDGFEVVAHVRNQPHLKNLPIIMVTSRSGEKHRTRAARLGVNDYLIKPYQEEEMMASIQKVLNDRGLEFPV